MAKPKQTVMILVGALVLSAGCTWLLGKRLLHGMGKQDFPGRHYVSAKRLIQPGETLRSGDVQALNWPANDPLTGALSKVEEVTGRTALYPMSPGQPILDRELSRPGSGSGLASKIPDGMRAIALKSDEVVGVAGFLMPGSHVDVLSTYRMTQGTEPSTSTVLQNAEVIAAGQQTEPDPQGKAVSTTVVTLLLDPQQAERALLASSQGSLHFVLRNSADKKIQAQAPVTLSQLTGIAPTLSPGVGSTSIMTGRLGGLGATAKHREPRKQEENYGIEIVLGDASSSGQPAKTATPIMPSAAAGLASIQSSGLPEMRDREAPAPMSGVNP